MCKFHIITVSFDFEKNQWILINHNKSKVVTENNLAAEIANALAPVFSSNRTTIFSTEVLVTRDNHQTMHACVNNWLNSNTMREAHKVTVAKANAKDSSGGMWHEIAAVNGNPELTKALLKTGSYFKRNWKSLLFFSVGGLIAVPGLVAAGVLSGGAFPVALDFGIGACIFVPPLFAVLFTKKLENIDVANANKRKILNEQLVTEANEFYAVKKETTLEKDAKYLIGTHASTLSTLTLNSSGCVENKEISEKSPLILSSSSSTSSSSSSAHGATAYGSSRLPLKQSVSSTDEKGEMEEQEYLSRHTSGSSTSYAGKKGS